MLLTLGPYSEAVDIVFTNGSWRSTYPPVCICLGHPLNPDNWAAYHTCQVFSESETTRPLMSLTLRKSHFAYGSCVGLFMFILVHRKLSLNYTKLQFLLFLLHPAVTPLLLSILSEFVCVYFQAISHAFYLQVCSSWKCIINFRENYLIFHK